MLAGFTIPVLFGNIVGGTALFVLFSYAQVTREIQNAASGREAPHYLVRANRESSLPIALAACAQPEDSTKGGRST
jgi:hypothetical protein